MMSSGLKVPIPAIPMPDLAVPMAAPAELRIIAAAHLEKKKKKKLISGVAGRCC